jgi:hypothetical protein
MVSTSCFLSEKRSVPRTSDVLRRPLWWYVLEPNLPVHLDAFQISETAPYFKKFEGLWPIHDMVAGYLLNMQTRRNRDLRDEKKASGLDPDESDGDSDGEDVEAEPAEVRHPKQSGNPVVDDLDQSDEELREVTPQGSPKKVRSSIS